MYFDFDDRYLDEGGVGSAINRRDGVLLSIAVHAAIIGLFLVVSALGLFEPRSPAEQVAAEAARERETPRFVFVQPQVDIESETPRERADASDRTRRSRSVEAPRLPENPLPSARGNSADRVEAAPDLRARGRGPAPEPAPPAPAVPEEPRVAEVRPPPSDSASVPAPVPAPPDRTEPQVAREARPAGGSLGEALQNLQKYVEQESFNNPNGGVQDMGPLQFDTKGVEFGPWIRRFIAQVRRNWFVPYAAMTMSGRVVLQFNVHKDGRITDLVVLRPADLDSFNTSAFNALAASNPTEPLPPEYPDEKAFFTVTFYYNEQPGGGSHK